MSIMPTAQTHAAMPPADAMPPRTTPSLADTQGTAPTVANSPDGMVIPLPPTHPLQPTIIGLTSSNADGNIAVYDNTDRLVVGSGDTRIYLIYVDGSTTKASPVTPKNYRARWMGSLPTANLGPSGAGWAIFLTGDSHAKRIASTYCGPVNTNNVAEHIAPLAALIDAHSCGISNVAIFSDSQNFIDHLPASLGGPGGRRACGIQFRSLITQFVQLAARFSQCTVRKVRGHSGNAGNDTADAAANNGRCRTGCIDDLGCTLCADSCPDFHRCLTHPSDYTDPATQAAAPGPYLTQVGPAALHPPADPTPDHPDFDYDRSARIELHSYEFLERLFVQHSDDNSPLLLNLNQLPTIRLIPDRCLDQYGACWTLMHNMLTAPHNLRVRKCGLILLIIHPQLLLHPAQGSPQRAAEIINRRCADFLAGRWESLWDIRPAPQSQAQQAARSQLYSVARSTHYDPAQDAMTRNTSFDICMSKIRAGGQLSRATKVLSSNGICADTIDTLTSLQALQFPAPDNEPHPLSAEQQRKYDRLAHYPLVADDDGNGYILNEEKIWKFLNVSFPKGVGADSTGMRFEHFNAVFKSGHSTAITAILQTVANGNLAFRVDENVPALHNPHLDDACRLIALMKPDGSERPITTPFALRRAAGKLLNMDVIPRAEKFFLQHNQLALTKDNCVLVSQILRCTLDRWPEFLLITTDKKCAFQTASRTLRCL